MVKGVPWNCDVLCYVSWYFIVLADRSLGSALWCIGAYVLIKEGLEAAFVGR